jgi:hypothetical protein
MRLRASLDGWPPGNSRHSPADEGSNARGRLDGVGASSAAAANAPTSPANGKQNQKSLRPIGRLCSKDRHLASSRYRLRHGPPDGRLGCRRVRRRGCRRRIRAIECPSRPARVHRVRISQARLRSTGAPPAVPGGRQSRSGPESALGWTLHGGGDDETPVHARLTWTSTESLTVRSEDAPTTS